jgi:alpha-glucosidase
MHDAQNLFDSKTSYAGEWNIDENWTALMPALLVSNMAMINEWTS